MLWRTERAGGGDDRPPKPTPPTGHILIGTDHTPFWLPPGLTAAMVRVRDVGPPSAGGG